MKQGGLTFVALALLFGAVAPAYPTLVAGGAIVLYATARPKALTTALLVLLLVVQGWRGCARMRAHEEARDALLAWRTSPARCDGVGVVVSSPARAGALRFDVRAEHVRCDESDTEWQGRIRLYSEQAGEEFARGDHIAFIAQLGVPEAYANDGFEHPQLSLGARDIVLSGGALYAHVTAPHHGFPALIDRARNFVRARIRATFTPDTEALARALMLGETDLSPEEGDRFRTSGLAHLLAVSGVHLAIAVGAAVRFARIALARIAWLTERMDVARIAAGFGVPLSWLYAEFAGGSGSARRAALMLSVSYGATAWGRRSSAPRSLLACTILASSIDPFVILDASFSLSFAATLGLMNLGSPLTHLFGRVVRWKPVATSLGATVAATLACIPVLATLGSSVPLAGIPLNLVAVPLGELAALPLCLLHGVLSPLPVLERFVAQAAGGALRLVDALAAIGSRFEGFELPPPTPAESAALVVGSTLALYFREKRAALLCVLGATVLFLGVAEARVRAPPGVLRVTFLDVGQGDSAVIETPTGAVIVVDGGGLVGSPTDIGKRVLLPFLKARRLRKVSLVVLSHPHPDHFGGLAAGLAGSHVDTVWDSGLGRKENVRGTYQLWLSSMERQRASFAPLEDICGAHVLDGVRIEVLAPCPAFAADRSANDNSIVLRITYGDRSVLFVGDAEHEEENVLLRQHREKLRSDVLKVGHHGSRTSTSGAFLAAVSPRIAVISCGVRNRFGHPYPTTLRTLAEAGIDVLRTDRRGAVTVESDGRALTVRTAK